MAIVRVEQNIFGLFKSNQIIEPKIGRKIGDGEVVVMSGDEVRVWVRGTNEYDQPFEFTLPYSNSEINGLSERIRREPSAGCLAGVFDFVTGHKVVYEWTDK